MCVIVSASDPQSTSWAHLFSTSAYSYSTRLNRIIYGPEADHLRLSPAIVAPHFPFRTIFYQHVNVPGTSMTFLSRWCSSIGVETSNSTVLWEAYTHRPVSSTNHLAFDWPSPALAYDFFANSFTRRCHQKDNLSFSNFGGVSRFLTCKNPE